MEDRHLNESGICVSSRNFPFLKGGGQPLMKANAHETTLDNIDQHGVEKRESYWKAIANNICIGKEKQLGVWGLAPRKNF